MTPTPDPALQLTIISSLWQEGLLAPFDKRKFYREVLGHEFDPHDKKAELLDEAVMQAILATPVDEVILQLTTLQWDGGDPIFYKIWETWDGHDRVFYVKDLSGIEQCSGLEGIEFTSGLDTQDLRPLAALKQLRHVMLFGPPFQNDLRPLLALPELERVRADIEPNPVNDAVVAELKRRGVEFPEAS